MNEMVDLLWKCTTHYDGTRFLTMMQAANLGHNVNIMPA